jgi:hypothetical protein
MSGPTRPPCSACRSVARWRIRLFDHVAGMGRAALLCGRHARGLRTGPKITDTYTILEVAELHFTGFRR